MKAMWKSSLQRGLFSYAICVTVANLVGLIIGLTGSDLGWMPEFAARVGGNATAAYLQTLLIGLIGFAFGAGSVLFEIEHWSFLRQGAVHLALTAAVWIPVELICFSPLYTPAIISFTASVVVTYATTWGIQYIVWRRTIRQLNERIHQRNEANDHERH